MTDHFVAFWNLENLFAPEGFPGREPWIAARVRSDLEGWSEQLFEQKLAQLATVIEQMNGGRGPDLLGVCEVENAFVLGRLSAKLNARMPHRTYGVVHADSTRDRRGIDTAFVYDTAVYTVDPQLIFSHFVIRRTGTRDLTQASFKTPSGRELVCLANHWPSRSGGAYESRGFRMTAGETLAYWHQRIWEERGSTIPILAMGDLNDDPFDESVTIHARASRERGDVERARTAARFYNLTWHYLEQAGQDHRGDSKLVHGTLYFGGNGNTFDQILVSRGLLIDDSPLQVDETSARIELFPPMVDHRVSQGPIRFGLPRGKPEENVNPSGFSDHFPVSVVLQET